MIVMKPIPVSITIDDAADRAGRRDVAVAHGRDRLQREPQRGADAVELLVVEHAHDDPAGNDDQDRRADDQPGGDARRRRILEEALDRRPWRRNAARHGPIVGSQPRGSIIRTG
jgi:hypothetical protein